MLKSPGSVEDGMPGRNVQRKPGTSRGSPRRSRTAKASRISRYATKSRCACEWGGWGRLSDDGPGQHNLDRSEGPRSRVSLSMIFDGSRRIFGSRYAMVFVLFPSLKLPRESVDSSGNKGGVEIMGP